jgi:hypothetical protein
MKNQSKLSYGRLKPTPLHHGCGNAHHSDLPLICRPPGAERKARAASPPHLSAWPLGSQSSAAPPHAHLLSK